MQHELKTWTSFYGEIIAKRKSFEVRLNDRDYNVGDTLILKEYLPNLQKYTGESVKVLVEYILHGGEFGLEPGYCIMAFNPNNITIMDNELDRRRTKEKA